MGKVLIIGKGSANQRFAPILRKAGYETTNLDRPEAAKAALKTPREKRHDLLLIDEENIIAEGKQKLPGIRRLTFIPIMVIGSGDEQNLVNALLQGADAYLSCSASNEMLLSQVNALMRRNPQPSASC